MWLSAVRRTSESPVPGSTFAGASASDAGPSPALRAKLEEFCDLLSRMIAELVPGLAISMGPIESRRRLDDLLGGSMEAAHVVHARMEGPFDSMAVFVGRGCIARWIDASLGGTGEVVHGTLGGLTALERRLSWLLVERIFEALTQTLSDLPGAGRIGMEAEVSSAAAGRALRDASGLLSVEMMLGPPANGELLTLVFPPAAAEWLSSRLADIDDRTRGKAVDDVWSKELANRLAGSVVLVSAVIDAGTIDLGDVANWKPGEMLRVEATSSSFVKLESADMALYLCELGKRGGQLMLRVESEVVEEPNVFAGCLQTESAFATVLSQSVT